MQLGASDTLRILRVPFEHSRAVSFALSSVDTSER